MPFEFKDTSIGDVFIAEPKVFDDDRGSFAELFKLADFKERGIENALTQVNYSRSKKDVLRGLHYQNPPKAQAKLVRCVSGEVFDVAVDIRNESSTYGKWVGETLTAENGRMLYVPRGFAHGYCVLSDEAEVVYFCDEQYAPEHEAGVRWDDPEIGVQWPIENPLLADRDAEYPTLSKAVNNFKL